jgi:5'-3' exonuclease
MVGMKIYLVDGTYELFRHHFGAPPRKSPDGREVGATVGLLRTLLLLLSDPDVTHLACAFDHPIESFRNDLFPGYKTGEGVDPDLLAQFSLAEEAVSALGIVIWPMDEFEADDALATAVSRFMSETKVDQIVLCSPDKDLMQLVSGSKVVSWDRRREIVTDEAGVIEKYGVGPGSIPDWLALVGDSADGIPGIPAWGAKSSTVVLARYKHIENIPEDYETWEVNVRGAKRLAENLNPERETAIFYRQLTTLRDDVPLIETFEDLEWRGAQPRMREICRAIGDEKLPEQVSRWKSSAGS